MTTVARQAAAEFNANLSTSFVIGDKIADIELGKNIRATTILVRTGYGLETKQKENSQPDYVINNLFEAACLIKKSLEESAAN